MSKRINLADLRDNPDVVKNIMSLVKKKEEPKQAANVNTPKKKKKKKKVHIKPQVAKVDTDEAPVVIVDMPVEEDAPEKEVKVKHDDDSLAKHNLILRHVKQAEGYFNQSSPVFTSMEILFSAAYRFAELKNRILLANGRQLCRDAIKLLDDKEKAKAKAAKKGKKLSRSELADFSIKEIKLELAELFQEIYTNLEFEDRKRQGTAYDDTHRQYSVNLSGSDTSSSPIVLTRANLMVTVGNVLDLEEIKRNTKHIEVVQVEWPIYAIKNALIVGFMPYSLPKKINEETLEAAMEVNFQLKAVPVPKPMRHRTSNRMWYYVPEYSGISIKSIAFADRSLNSDFEAFKSLSNSPSADDVRFFFLRTGIGELAVEGIVRRWQACVSHQGRITILNNEYNSITLRQKTLRLREAREQLKASNSELIVSRYRMIDRLEQIDVEKAEIKREFATLASFTGNADQGMPIGQYKRLEVQFERFENAAVRGITDSFERIRIRTGVHQDKIKCRKLYYEYQSISAESKRLHRQIKMITAELEGRRQLAFAETSGKAA